MEFAITRGSSRPSIEIRLTDALGAPIDLTGATDPRLCVAPEYQTAQGYLSLYKLLTVQAPATAGILTGTWTSAETASLVAGRYHAMIQVTQGGQVHKHGPFDFVIGPSVSS